MINDIIISTKAPYQPFEKKINLADLASIVEEIWDDQDDWITIYSPYLFINYFIITNRHNCSWTYFSQLIFPQKPFIVQ